MYILLLIASYGCKILDRTKYKIYFFLEHYIDHFWILEDTLHPGQIKKNISPLIFINYKNHKNIRLPVPSYHRRPLEIDLSPMKPHKKLYYVSSVDGFNL